MTIKIGILGFAHGHVNLYCREWRNAHEPGVSVQAGWDHDAERLENAVKAFDIEPCNTAEELVARKDISGVVIAAETSLHA